MHIHCELCKNPRQEYISAKIIRCNVENCVHWWLNVCNFKWIGETETKRINYTVIFRCDYTSKKREAFVYFFLFLENVHMNAAIKHKSSNIVRSQCVSNKLKWNYLHYTCSLLIHIIQYSYIYVQCTCTLPTNFDKNIKCTVKWNESIFRSYIIRLYQDLKISNAMAIHVFKICWTVQTAQCTYDTRTIRCKKKKMPKEGVI